MSFYGAVIALIAAAGVWLFVAGWVGQPVREPRPRLRMDVDLARFGWSALIAVIVFGVVTAATGWPAAGVTFATVSVMVPMFMATHRLRRQAVARTEALASWAEMLRDTISAHAGLHQAVAVSSVVAPAAIRADVRRLAVRSEQMPLSRALRMFAADVADPVSDLIVAALTIADEHQAQNLPQLLGRVASTTREQAAMRLRVEAQRAQTYASARALVVITLFMAVVLMFTSPQFMDPFDSVVGQVVMLIIGALFSGAVWALMLMSRPVPVPRMLAGIEHADTERSVVR